MVHRLIYQIVLLVGLTLLYNGCGGDSSSSNGGFATYNSGGTAQKQPNGEVTKEEHITDTSIATGTRETKSGQKAIFVDTFCSGISYTAISVDNTITGTGTTGADGYAYIPEGSAYIQFEIGGLVLGKVKTSQVITITELFRNSNLDDKRVMFAARLLLTLDEDGNASNGIQISEEVSNKIGQFEGSDAIGHYRLTTLNKNEEEVTAILNELVDFLGIPRDRVVSAKDARAHLENSMTELEEGVFTEVIKPGENDNCPYGGIARVHRVDFDKTDDNDTLKEYVDYFCDEMTTFDRKQHFRLAKGNEKCPNGGIRIHHTLYLESTRFDPNSQNEDGRTPISEYDEYKCNGAEAYKYKAYTIYTVAPSTDECEHVIKKEIQTKKENGVAVISRATEYKCVDIDGHYIELVTLVKDDTCKNGGVRLDDFKDEEKKYLMYSSHYCNQVTEKGYVQGEHKIETVEANSSVCPDGGLEFKHSVDTDNNGEFDTFYSEIKCNNSPKNGDSKKKVTISVNRVLLEKGMSDFSKCPYGGYRLEKTMKQGNKIIAQWNDYNCTDTTDLVRDEVTPITLKASDYNSTKNEWCPNGGIKYEHKVYFNGELNHQYFDINCSPVTTSEKNETITLEIGDKTCPYGGKIVIHKVIFNGDEGHPSNYEYNTTHCNGFDYNDTEEKVILIREYSDVNVECKVESHQIFYKGVHLSQFDYNSTTCSGLEWDKAILNEKVERLPIGSKLCPDGGQKITYERSKPDGTVIDEWTYSVVKCNGLDYNDTKEINETRILEFGNPICPYGGKIVLHKRYTKDTGEHVAKWDYNTTHCNSFEYNETKEEVTVVKTYILGDGNTVCPDGGVVKNHKRYILDKDGNKIYVPSWEYNTTHCEGLDYNETEDIPEVIDNNPEVCPYGGKVILHKRYTKDSGIHIARWDYKTTICNSLDYNETIDKPVVDVLEIGSPVCPDGGKVIHHKRYADLDGDGEKDDHIVDWDYSETICDGLDYNETVEKQIVTVWGYGENDICPYGGKFIQHQRYFDDNKNGKYDENIDVIHIEKWDYNTTHCNGLDYNETTEEKVVEKLEFGDETCPDGGERITHKFYIVEDGEKKYIDEWEYTNVVCDGLDYNDTVEKKIVTVWEYGESEVCPDGGEFVQHQRYIDSNKNGKYEEDIDVIHVEKWDYNTTHCYGLDYNDTKDFPIELDASEDICPDGGKVIIHQRWTVDKDGNQIAHIEKWDYKSVVCKGLEWNATTEKKVVAKVHEFGSSICPDGGVTYTYQRWLGDNHIAKWDYNVTVCEGLDWNETIDKPITTLLPFGDKTCPDGGKFIQHRRFADLDKDGEYETHVEKWDYNTTHCEGLDYNETEEEKISVSASKDVCPDGGHVITHKRYILDGEGNKVYIDKWEYTSVECDRLDYNDTKDFPIEHTIEFGSGICPDGGKLIEHQRWTVDEDGNKVEHIAKWDYNTTHCIGLDYNDTVEKQIVTVWGYGESDVCPDGGKFIQHQRYIDSNKNGKYEEDIDIIHVKKWDYNTTHCTGLDYNQTEDRPIVTIWKYGESEVCPDGGKFVQHKIYIKGTDIHVAKWDYNTTHCRGLDYNETKDIPVEHQLEIGNKICPYGGKIVEHKRFADFDGDGEYETHIAKWDYNTTHCRGLEYNETLKYEENTTLEVGDKTCPDGGTIVTTIRYVDLNGNGEFDKDVDKAIKDWTFTSVYCKGLDYNETLKHEINTTLEVGSDICPDGGTIVTTIRYIDTNGNGVYDEGVDEHIAKWDFNSTYCKGLDYNETLEHNISVELEPNPEVCPYGGKEITHIRYIDKDGDGTYTEGVDTKIDKWTFKTTHCSEGNQSDHVNEIILPVGDKSCPNGGKIVEHNVTNNGVVVSNFSETRCGREGVSYDVGLDSNFSVAGYVTDMNGSRIEGATVTINVNGKVYKVVTGVNGVYQFYNVTKGSKISVSADGYIPVKDLVVKDSVLDVVLVPSRLAYVKDMKLIFFPINREMGADKAMEYANVKGWRLLTFDELQALYYSDRRKEFTPDEYFSSTNELDAYGNPVGDEYGYTLWTLNFADGTKLPHWFSHRKHVVFTDVEDKKPISAKEFIETKEWANWYTANSICSALGKRLPTVEEMKTIYFNSGHPIGIADKKVTGGEYWTLSIVTNVDKFGNQYKSAKFFRVVGPVEDYYIEKYGDPNNPKKVLCVTPDPDETATIKGVVKDWSGKALFDVKVKFRKMDYLGHKGATYVAKTDNNGEYSITLPSSRYYVEFDPTEYASQIMKTRYRTESMTIDLYRDMTLDMNFTAPNLQADYYNDSDEVCGDVAESSASECERIAFSIHSNLDTDSDTWTYSVEKTADANVNMLYFTLKLSPLCMEQITDLRGGEPVALNDLGIIDGIKSTSGDISFIVHSSAEYNPDVDTPLTITTDHGQRASANIATPVCFHLDENHSVAGQVVDTYGNPVAGATITVITTYQGPNGEEHSEYQFHTDGDGRFTDKVNINFKNATISAVFLAQKEGYDSLEDAQKTVTLERDIVNQIGTLVLKPQPIDIGGVVKDSNGVPLAGAEVTIKDKDGNELTTLTTDSNGAYSYTTEVGQKLTIEVSAELHETKQLSPTVTLSLHEFNFELEQVAVDVNISSTIIESGNGNAVAGAEIRATDASGNLLAVVQSDENGKFTISLRKDVKESLDINLNVSAKGYKEQSIKIEGITTESKQLDSISLDALPSIIELVVEDENWHGLENASINLYVDDAEEPIAQAVTNSDGVAKIENIRAGAYRLSVSLAGYAVSSIPVITERGETHYIYISMVKQEDNEDSNISAVAQGVINSYNENGEIVGTSKFEVSTLYRDDTSTWQYSVSRSSVEGKGVDLYGFTLGLDSDCIANIKDVADGYTFVKDFPMIENGISWRTKASGTFSFKIDGEFEHSKTVFVPIIIQAGTDGKETLVLNVPGPVCQ